MSEIKTTVAVPDGWVRLGADVASEELWLSDLLGEAEVGIIGGTPSGQMTLLGSSKNKTDMHSRFAAEFNISRDGAKQISYSRRYGAGLAATTTYFRQHKKSLSDSQAKEIAKLSIEKTKGKKNQGRYYGGSESTMFNAMERIATSYDPRTPLLNCAISDALHPKNVGKEHMTSRVNWVVQSAGVDFLHLIITATIYLFKKSGITYRFMLSLHDEIVWLVPKSESAKAAYCFQVAHLWTRAYAYWKLGFNDIPLTVAFFDAVDIDHTFRKTVKDPCVTPSNPNPIPPGEEVPLNRILNAIGDWQPY